MFGRRDPAPEALEPVELEAYVPELDFSAPLAEEAPPWPVSDTDLGEPEVVQTDQVRGEFDTAIRIGAFLGATTATAVTFVLFRDGRVSQEEYIASGFTNVGLYMFANILLTTYRFRHPRSQPKQD